MSSQESWPFTAGRKSTKDPTMSPPPNSTTKGSTSPMLLISTAISGGRRNTSDAIVSGTIYKTLPSTTKLEVELTIQSDRQ